MRILLVNQRLGYSSTTSYSLELCRALRGRGHALRLCTGGGELHETFRAEGVESYSVKFNFFAFRALLRYLRDYEPELIHVQNLRSLPMGRKIAERLRRKYVLTVHHLPPGIHEELQHPLLAGVIAVNEVVRENLVNAQRLPKELIRVIRPGVNLEHFKPGAPSLSRTESIPVIGSIGRLSRLKGYEYLIAAARRVVDSGREAMFVIVGGGEEERSLRAEVRRLGLERQITFCPPLPDIAELLRTFDIVVIPTLRGGVGLAALEAMAMERPLVASSVGELLQVISDGVNGLVVRERDPIDIAEKVVHLLDAPDEARRLGAAGRQLVEEEFSLTRMVDATEVFYQDLLEEILVPR